jgi:histidyl-tRNA synthetase
MDIIGESGPMADSEIIGAALDIVRLLGMTSSDIKVRLSDRRVIQALLLAGGVLEEQLPTVYRAVDKLEREDRGKLLKDLLSAGLDGDTAARALETGALRGLDAVAAAVSAVNRDGAADGLSQCIEYLTAMGFADFIEVDLSIVRGLDYYTGVVFELFDAGRSLRAICGGGRYDGLLNELGGVDLPAVGFGMGDVVLGELLKDRGWTSDSASGLDAFLVAVTGEDVPTVLSLAHAMRERGISVEYALRRQAIGKQLKIADARSAATALIVGPDERAAGLAVVRELKTGTERKVPFEQVVEIFPDGGEAIVRAMRSEASGEV